MAKTERSRGGTNRHPLALSVARRIWGHFKVPAINPARQIGQLLEAELPEQADSVVAADGMVAVDDGLPIAQVGHFGHAI